MAARGLVAVRGAEQVTLLAQLSVDASSDVRQHAVRTLRGLPEEVLLPACEAPLPEAVLSLLGAEIEADEARTRIVANPATPDSAVAHIARVASETVSERISVNEQRLLRHPVIIEALYMNRNTRMSTADRLIEFAARHALALEGIPAYTAHVEALRDQLIPEPSEAPLPQDLAFADTLVADADDFAFDEDDIAGSETIKARFKPLNLAIVDMSKTEKIRLAMIGGIAARAILVRDRDKQIAFAAVSSPNATSAEAAEIAKSREVSEEILRYIGNRKEFLKNPEVKTNLCFNPKCPQGISLKFMGHLRQDQLKKLSLNRNVPAQVRLLARQRMSQKS